jgi:2-amino-4-hydroxy-6-hydroxymethyldihydropteridine diphosphokinase
MGKVFLSLGTNLEDRKVFLEKSIAMIIKRIGSVLSMSSIYQTEPWGFNTEKLFLNQVILVESTLAPKKILKEIHLIEKKIGRVKTSAGFESRIIDIDILFYDEWILNERDLIIPHPHIGDRKFVLLPMVEVSPQFIHPVLKKNMLYLASNCTDNHLVEVFKEKTNQNLS